MLLAVAAGHQPATAPLGRRSSRRIRSCGPSCRAHVKDRSNTIRNRDVVPPTASDNTAIPHAQLSNLHSAQARHNRNLYLPAVSSFEASRTPAARATGIVLQRQASEKP